MEEQENMENNREMEERERKAKEEFQPPINEKKKDNHNKTEEKSQQKEKSQESAKEIQHKITISSHNSPKQSTEPAELTKRSDESEFVNWKISTVKSGQFCFEESKQKSIELVLDEVVMNETEQKKIDVKQTKEEMPIATEEEKEKKGNFKLLKTLSAAKKEMVKYFTQELTSALKKMKSVKRLFSHFCKQNNLTSIKSTLFEDKQKSMEEMSLNKWMVFCKQFDILEGLYKIKVNASKELENKSFVQGKEQLKVKQLKKAQEILINIFKAVNKNLSKLNFDCFVEALLLIYQQFKSIYGFDEDGARRFLSEILHCQSEKQCLKKLSTLKFTAGTPKISYQKITVASPDVNTLSRTRLSRTDNKQNRIEKSTGTKGMPYSSTSKFKVNSVIRDAKEAIQKKQAPKYSMHSQKNRPKLILDSLKRTKERTNSQKDLIEYFQASKDPILDSYFMLQQQKQSMKGKN